MKILGKLSSCMWEFPDSILAKLKLLDYIENGNWDHFFLLNSPCYTCPFEGLYMTITLHELKDLFWFITENIIKVYQSLQEEKSIIM